MKFLKYFLCMVTLVFGLCWFSYGSELIPLWLGLTVCYFLGAFTIGQWIGKQSILIWKKRVPFWKAIWFFPLTVYSNFHSDEKVYIKRMRSADYRPLLLSEVTLFYHEFIDSFEFRSLTEQKWYTATTMFIWPLRIVSNLGMLLWVGFLAIWCAIRKFFKHKIPNAVSSQLGKGLE